MGEIVQKDDPVLRKKAQDVDISKIGSEKIKSTLERMSIALDGEVRGVALAAPQIGESLRIFIVSGALFARDKDTSHPDLVFINPIIQELSPNRSWLDEGCLSCGTQYGEAQRSTEATISAYNKYGKQFTMNGSGLLAQIFQHEIDHLDGILFIDHARNIRELTSNEQKTRKDSLDIDQI